MFSKIKRAGPACLVLTLGALVLSACGGESKPAAPSLPKVALADLPEPWNHGDLAHGAEVFLKCHNCHSLDPAEGDKQGPNLHGVFARKPGTKPGFHYSAALQKLDVPIWTYAEVDKWVSNPSNYVHGTKMMFNGIDDPTDRRDLIAYLATKSTE